MKKTISRQVLLIAVVNFWFIQSAAIEASIITDIAIGDEYLELEYDAGSGSSVSYVVVDLSNTGGATYAFGYHYDSPSTTAHDALVALDAAGDLQYDYTMHDFGGGSIPFADNFSYQGESGIVANYWSYSLGIYDILAADVSWSGAATGAGEQLLEDGGFQGWYNGFGPPPNFAAVDPELPTAALTIPEPRAIVLVWASLLLLVCSRRVLRGARNWQTESSER